MILFLQTEVAGSPNHGYLWTTRTQSPAVGVVNSQPVELVRAAKAGRLSPVRGSNHFASATTGQAPGNTFTTRCSGTYISTRLPASVLAAAI